MKSSLRLILPLALGLLTLASSPALCKPFRVVTYNIWGLPSPLLRHSERFDEIPNAINSLNADVVLIQEAFSGKARALTRLPSFPYFAWGPKSHFFHFSSGLLILSRYPIEETARITYSRCGGFDCFANKGAIYARIRVPGIGPVSVFDTHLNANGHDAVRIAQAAHLARFVRVYSQGLPTIVGGDFNGDGQVLFHEAKQTVAFRDAHAEYVRQTPTASDEARDGYTADPRHNHFLGDDETLRRLDHIFLIDGSANARDAHPLEWKVSDYELVFDGIRGKVLSDHFGVSVLTDISSRVE